MKNEILFKVTKKIFLISCCGQKLATGAQASELYTSSLFAKSLAYCQSRSALDTETYILSAKYGLLWTGDYAEPYDLSLLDLPVEGRKQWAEKVFSQLAAMERIEKLQIVALAGEKYREFLVPALVGAGAKVSIPMKGLGIGEQLAYLERHSRLL